MGAYSSAPRKGKVSEEEGDENLSYATSGMQGWRASMEDAHIALLKVPHGKPPTAAAIGAARIGLFSSQSNKPPLGNSSRGGNGGPSGSVRGGGGCLGADAAISRGRSGTFSAGDTREFFPQQQQESRSTDGTPPQQGDAGDAGASAGASSGRASAGISTGDEDKATTRLTAGGGGGGEESGSAGAGWKAVDLLEDAALFGVFDGHGGKAVADFCKERLPGLLAASPDIRAGNWRDGFPRVYHALDALLSSGEGQEKAGGWGGSTKVDGIGMGCTIVTALLDRKRGQCYVAHAGDSRCVLCRAGRAVQLTRDHKPGMPSEYARIVAAGGHVSRAGRVNDNLNLSRAIGDIVYKRNRLRQPKDQIISAEPDVCRFLMTPGVDEFLILACDGVWEMMNTTQVVAFVRSGLRGGSPPREVCESLLDACLSPDPKGTRYAGCDNMTVVLVLLDGWESALVTKAYTPALTFSGGRFSSAAEAAAAMSLPKKPKPLSNVRPPLPAEFLAVKPEVTTAPPPPATADDLQASTEPGAANSEKPAIAAAEAAAAARTAAAAAAAAAAARATPTSSSGAGSQGDAISDAEDKVVTLGWPQQRIAAGKVAPPRTAHGIEFALASFSAPIVTPAVRAGSRMSTGSINGRRGAPAAAAAAAAATASASAAVGDLAAPGGARQRSVSQAGSSSVPPNSRRRNTNHMRSATAPLLPSPLLHRRRREPPSEERIANAAAIAMLADVGAAGAVAAAGAAGAEENAAPSHQHPSTDEESASKAQHLDPLNAAGTGSRTGEGLGRQAPPSEVAGLVFVPVAQELTPSKVTVTAVTSPSGSVRST